MKIGTYKQVKIKLQKDSTKCITNLPSMCKNPNTERESIYIYRNIRYFYFRRINKTENNQYLHVRIDIIYQCIKICKSIVIYYVF